MSGKVYVRFGIPDTSSSSGVCVVYSVPYLGEEDRRFVQQMGKYVVISPVEMDGANGCAQRVVTWANRARWLLGLGLSGLVLPEVFSRPVTSEEEAEERYFLLRDFLYEGTTPAVREALAYMEEIREKESQGSQTHKRGTEKGSRSRFEASRNFLRLWLDGVERHRWKPAVYVPPFFVDRNVFICPEDPSRDWETLLLPPSHFMVSIFQGEEGRVFLSPEDYSVQVEGRYQRYEWGRRAIEQSGQIYGVFAPELFIQSVLTGYLAPEFVPETLEKWVPPFVSFAEVLRNKKLAALTVNAKSLGGLKEGLSKIIRLFVRTGNKRLENACAFLPEQSTSQTDSGTPHPDQPANSREFVAEMVLGFAEQMGSMAIPDEGFPYIEKSRDDRYHLVFLVSGPIGENVINYRA